MPGKLEQEERGVGSKAKQWLALFQRPGLRGCWPRKPSGGPVQKVTPVGATTPLLGLEFWCIRSRLGLLRSSLRLVQGVLRFNSRQLLGHMDTLGCVLSIQVYTCPTCLPVDPWGLPLKTSKPLHSCIPSPPLSDPATFVETTMCQALCKVLGLRWGASRSPCPSEAVSQVGTE